MSIQQADWFTIRNIQEVDSPAMLVYPDRVHFNIGAAIAMIGEVARLRPHIKTNKSPDAIRMMMDAGIQRFKCATIAEAELLAEVGAGDVLLAYQPLGPKLHRFIDLIRKYPSTSFSCLVDNSKVATEQSNAFASAGMKVPVYIDLNIGMNRTGIQPGKAAIELYHQLSTSAGTYPAGIHAYDGHIRDSDLTTRTAKCNAGFENVTRLKLELEAEGMHVPAIIAGGSPTFPIHAKRKEVECSPGTFVYWDQGYTEAFPDQPFKIAVALVTRIVSLPTADQICTDLGHKSVSAENDIGHRVSFPGIHSLLPVGQSEEHLVLQVNDSTQYAAGDVLYGIPFHVCPTVNLYERLLTVENEVVTGEWMNVARDRKLTV